MRAAGNFYGEIDKGSDATPARLTKSACRGAPVVSKKVFQVELDFRLRDAKSFNGPLRTRALGSSRPQIWTDSQMIRLNDH